ncbi:MAG: hypothetical protein R3E66_24395 [bacterium]
MNQNIARIFLALVFTLGWLSSADALPIYAITSAAKCDTCHIEPLGWANPDISARRCTLDCVGCHYSPAGGGLRTPDGQYYGKEVLPMYGERPSAFANPEKYRPKGFPKRGIYKFGKGFSGWWPGRIDHHTIPDRYGDIDPKPEWKFGTDVRVMALSDSSNPDSPFVFPMQGELYAMNESVDDLIFYVSAGLQAQKDTNNYENVDKRDYFTVREIFMKYRLPYNSYVRFGRIVPRYGWRTDDHTAFIRQDLGFNQFYQAMGMDAGYNPNYLYADASLYYQGLARWPGERLERGIGTTVNLGFRDLGYHVGSSFHYLNKANGFDQITAGIQYGLNFDPLGIYGELDVKHLISDEDGIDSVNGFYAFHELNYNVTRGVYTRLKYDWGDPNIKFKDDQKHRVQFALDYHPYTFVDLEAAYRVNWSPRIDFTDIASTEAFLIVHLWL